MNISTEIEQLSRGFDLVFAEQLEIGGSGGESKTVEINTPLFIVAVVTEGEHDWELSTQAKLKEGQYIDDELSRNLSDYEIIFDEGNEKEISEYLDTLLPVRDFQIENNSGETKKYDVYIFEVS